MIFGTGVDIVEVNRFSELINKPDFINRFFNKEEQKSFKNSQAMCEHYASRFAAKEAFGKALGIGLAGFSLTDVFVKKDEKGKPYLAVENKAEEILKNTCGDCKIHLSISHEKTIAIAYVIIETIRE